MSDATLGGAFAEAFAAKDVAQIAALLHPEIDFHGLTPNRTWKAKGAEQVVSKILQHWLDDFDDGAELVEVASHSFADTESLTYRFTAHDAEGPFVCEQHAYLTEDGGRINWMRVVCSGFCAQSESAR
jgi:hypothetical protein